MSDDFGTPLEPWTRGESISAAWRYICQPNEPHVDAYQWPEGDHGHSSCLFIGALLAETKEQADRIAAIDALCEQAFRGGFTRSGAMLYAESIHRILHPEDGDQ